MAIRHAVSAVPGHTAHWYRQRGYFPMFRFSWVYRDFLSAAKKGLIEREVEKGVTRYFPVSK